MSGGWAISGVPQSARGSFFAAKHPGRLYAKNWLWEQFAGISDAWALAQGIVDTVREPVLVLDKDLRVIAASRSFYSAFKVSPRTPKAGFFTPWAMDNGTFQNFACCWKKSFPSKA